MDLLGKRVESIQIKIEQKVVNRVYSATKTCERTEAPRSRSEGETTKLVFNKEALKQSRRT